MDRRWNAARHAIGLAMLVALAGGCTTAPPNGATAEERVQTRATAEEQVQAWLAEAPRELVVKVNPALPAGSVRVWDYRPGERIEKGAGWAATGAAYTVLGGCRAGGPLGCAVGMVFAPVGAVVGGVAGAVSVKSVVNVHALGEAQGAPELYATAVDPQFAARLASAVVARSREYFAAEDRGPIPLDGARKLLGGQGTGVPIWSTSPRHKHTFLLTEKPAAGQGELTIYITALDLVGDVGDDPRIALVMEVRFNVASAASAPADWGRFTYEGSARRISEWRKNDAAAFRDELDNAMRAIASEVVVRF